MNELMDLYTMAIEYYNCTSDIDNQEYFQGKLLALLTSYSIMHDTKDHLPISPASGALNARNEVKDQKIIQETTEALNQGQSTPS
jgi:hypothetical protein